MVNHTAVDVLPDFNEEVERDYSRRYWASGYSDSSWARMEKFTWPKVDCVVADPRTYHPLDQTSSSTNR